MTRSTPTGGHHPPSDGERATPPPAPPATPPARQRRFDIAYRTISTPIGTLLLAATEAGLVRVAFESEGHDLVLAALAAQFGPRVLEEPGHLDPVAAELEEYFAGQRRAFGIPLDYAMSSGFRQTVQRCLPQIGYGQTRSYKQLAQLAGRPGAARTAGTACATNPLPIVLPCHRVLRSDGSLGGYLGGLDAKKALLALERPA